MFKSMLGDLIKSIGVILLSIHLTEGRVLAADPRAFASLYTFDQLKSEPALEEIHFELLKQRFANNDFAEILFPNSNARGPRLERVHHKLMFDAIIRFLSQSSTINPDAYLSERPALDPFSVTYSDGVAKVSQLSFDHSRFGAFLDDQKQIFNSNGYLSILSPGARDQLVRIVARRNSNVTSIFNLSANHLLANPELFKTMLIATRDMFSYEKSDATLKSAANLAIAYWMQSNHLISGKKSFDSLSPIDQLFLKSSFQSAARGLISQFEMPGKLRNNFFKYAGFDANELSISSRGIYVVPMSRWEHMFKGIGPGECIRTSCNRFFDALYPDALGFSIIKDGKEIGYIGIYKVREKTGPLKLWYIDTFQSPGLVSETGSHKILDEILASLERYALDDGALLAVASKDWNSINYKENASVLQTRGVLDTIEVGYFASPVFDEIYKFISADEQAHHQKIMSMSGYTKESKMMYDSLYRNEYKVRILEPSRNLSDFDLARAASILGKKMATSSLALRNPLIRRIENLRLFGQNAPGIRFRIYETFKNARLFFSNSSAGRMEINRSLFPYLSKNIPQFNFDLPLTSVDLTTNSPEDRQRILMELVLLSENFEHSLQLINEHGNKSHEFAQIAVEFIIPLLEDRGFKDWNSLFSTILGQGIDNEVDLSFAYEISERIESQEEFLKFAKIATGQMGPAYVGDYDRLDALILARFQNFLSRYPDFDSQSNCTGAVIDCLKGRANIKARRLLFNKAQTIEQVVTVAKLLKSPKYDFLPEYYEVIADALLRLKFQSLADFDAFTNSKEMIPKSRMIELAIHVVDGLKTVPNVDWIQVYKTLGSMIEYGSDKNADIARAILNIDLHIDLKAFFSLREYSSPATVYRQLAEETITKRIRSELAGTKESKARLEFIRDHILMVSESVRDVLMPELISNATTGYEAIMIFRNYFSYASYNSRYSLLFLLGQKLKSFPRTEEYQKELTELFDQNYVATLRLLDGLDENGKLQIKIPVRDLLKTLSRLEDEESRLRVVRWIGQENESEVNQVGRDLESQGPGWWARVTGQRSQPALAGWYEYKKRRPKKPTVLTSVLTTIRSKTADCDGSLANRRQRSN